MKLDGIVGREMWLTTKATAGTHGFRHACSGLVVPKGTPKDIIGKLNAAGVAALADPAVRSRLADLGLEVFPPEHQTPEALGALVKADAEKWWPIIKEAGIKAE